MCNWFRSAEDGATLALRGTGAAGAVAGFFRGAAAFFSTCGGVGFAAAGFAAAGFAAGGFAVAGFAAAGGSPTGFAVSGFAAGGLTAGGFGTAGFAAASRAGGFGFSGAGFGEGFLSDDEGRFFSGIKRMASLTDL